MKYSRVLAGAIAAVAFLTPMASSALTLDDLNQQIAALLSQVAALQQKIAAQPQASASVAPAQTVVSVPAPTASAASCPQLSRSLSLGARGDDVLSLQHFFAAQGLITADNATGYFGALTQSAVQEWQSAHGVVASGSPSTTGFGAVGGRTRSLIALNCSGGGSASLNTPSSAGQNTSCPVALPPTEICSTGWKVNTDLYGCTKSYSCISVLQTVTPASSHKCVLYSLPTCASGSVLQGGTLDANGCAGPAHCVASSTSVTF